VASEVNQGTRFDEAKVKELTGGDTITARFMNKDFFTFAPTHHLWLMGNHQPEVKTGGDSFWRRLRMVPFLHKVPDHKKIGNLSDLLIQEEGPGILAWVIRGAQDVFSGGLREPESVMAATNEYAAEEDHLSRFLEETVRMGGGEHVLLETGQLRQAYETWCKDEGIKDAFSAQTFGRELKLKNIKSKKSNGKRFYIGLSLVDAIPDNRGRQGQ
jgi:P4 family phage/plasmid primase-like protien